jgi:hypothetical protein
MWKSIEVKYYVQCNLENSRTLAIVAPSMLHQLALEIRHYQR